VTHILILTIFKPKVPAMTPLLLAVCAALLMQSAFGWFSLPHRRAVILPRSRNSIAGRDTLKPLFSLAAPASPPQKSKDPALAIEWATDDDTYGEDDAEDQDFLTFLQDEFDSIATNGLLTFDQFIEWEECQDILADEFLTLKDFLRIWQKVVGSNTKSCDFETFLAVNEAVDLAV